MCGRERGEELDDMCVDVLTENHALETDCVEIQNVHVLGLREATRHLDRTEAVASVAALRIETKPMSSSTGR